jgi:hypothetical protein
MHEENIQIYVERCLRCQVSKAEKIRNSRLLQPIEVPNSKFESISMDFIVSLPDT